MNNNNLAIELTTPLMSHQVDAVNKMLPSRVGGLFMEMGTGKSRVAIELIAKRQHKIDKVVYFCPVSLKETVVQEIIKHTNCKQSDICVFNSRSNAQNIAGYFWYIVGTESISSSTRVFFAVNSLITDKSFVIVDESSYIKGFFSNRSKRIIQLSEKARYRLVMTGTPMSQGVVDLFSQFYFLSPKILGYNSFYSFAANHLEYSEKYPGLIVESHNLAFLAKKISPYTYQVTKDECLDLPDKIYETRTFYMTEMQRSWYKAVKEDFLYQMEWLLEQDHFRSIYIFRLFSALQQVACGFYNERITPIGEKLFGEKPEYKFHEFDNPRIDLLLSTLREIPSDKKVVIFCKYQQDIKYISEALADKYGKDSFALFYGKINEQERAGQVEKFRSSARFFVATQQSGGHGLTLNEASYVIFYNNAFKYSERLQAEDRCHRIGQTKKVTYIDLYCYDSIDWRIQDALTKKGNAVRDFAREVEKVKKNKLKELIKKL